MRKHSGVTFVVLTLNKAYVLALNTAHVLRLNKADVLAPNMAYVLRLNTKVCTKGGRRPKAAPCVEAAEGRLLCVGLGTLGISEW